MKRRTTRTRRTAAAIALGIAAAVALPSVAAAKSGDVRRAGTCNTSATSKLKLSPENGRIEVEFEVDQNRRGVRWRVVVTRAISASMMSVVVAEPAAKRSAATR